MKKKLFLLLFILLACATGIYFYLYQGHRNIAAETPVFSITVRGLQNEFTANDSVAYKKYQDKTVHVSGKLSSIDPIGKAVIVDGKLFAIFLKTVPAHLRVNQDVTIKGRFLGYDDLAEEFRMDQTIVVE